MMSKLTDRQVTIKLDGLTLNGNLSVPANALGIVIFSHGSGSSRLSPRNNYVAQMLQEKGLATLLFDLLTEVEDRLFQNRFNIDLLTMRLIDVTQWVQHQKETKDLPIGYFGASTGAASALRAAAFYGEDIKAVVSRGGRPDLALDDLSRVTAPTLFVVGGWDKVVIELNEKAFEKLQCERKLEIIPHATHLFEEAGKLAKVANLSAEWFADHMQIQKEEQNVQRSN
ncbi:alpha/beta hydrolase [Flavobacteriaceae bacterium TP-CH-4]|uniref:Alpha/beta hydrolase n=1 Tax=Pelagihabitans pacificus TaxID=2696054 RepID=A0A967AY40_9FLAO|nr:alpha/beta hydrolase [Pelagihabitans pacificus]NHF59727.1 alpha/beta hydrolase [Pelagihabitans pacificus]